MSEQFISLVVVRRILKIVSESNHQFDQDGQAARGFDMIAAAFLNGRSNEFARAHQAARLKLAGILFNEVSDHAVNVRIVATFP